jgi:hypothetical protein
MEKLSLPLQSDLKEGPVCTVCTAAPNAASRARPSRKVIAKFCRRRNTQNTTIARPIDSTRAWYVSPVCALSTSLADSILFYAGRGR